MSSVKLPNGSVVSIASTYGAVKAMSSITNASSAVADLGASHGVLADDILEITSGWTKLNARIARVSVVVTDDVTLEGIDTTSTARYPAGSGIGSVRVISDWVQIAQVTGFESSGGDQQFATYSFLEDDDEHQIPTVKGATSIAITIADDPTLPHYAILEAADEDREPRALKVDLPNGSVIYYNGYISFNKTPSMTKNNIMEVKANASLVAQLTRYAS
jgi:hypothetical protein